MFLLLERQAGPQPHEDHDEKGLDPKRNAEERERKDWNYSCNSLVAEHIKSEKQSGKMQEGEPHQETVGVA